MDQFHVRYRSVIHRLCWDMLYHVIYVSVYRLPWTSYTSATGVQYTTLPSRLCWDMLYHVIYVSIYRLSWTRVWMGFTERIMVIFNTD